MHLGSFAFKVIILFVLLVSFLTPPMAYFRYKEMKRCISPFPEVSSANEVAGGELKKFPARLFAVPPRMAKGLAPDVTVESYQEDR